MDVVLNKRLFPFFFLFMYFVYIQSLSMQVTKSRIQIFIKVMNKNCNIISIVNKMKSDILDHYEIKKRHFKIDFKEE